MLSVNYQAFVGRIRSRFLGSQTHRAAEDAAKATTAIAHTDDLTGLPNRLWLQSSLVARVEKGRLNAEPFAVGLLDLDGFKPINDIHGHAVGDAILVAVANRLASAIEGRGQAARMGGDEFAVVCDGVGAPDEALAVGKELQAIFAAPFVVDQLSIHLNCTFGFALFPASADEADQLVRLADVALYRAKANRRSDVGVFDVSDENAAIERATLEQALHRAVAEGTIGVEFQPIVDLATGRVSGFESLARWRDPRLGTIPPSVFIPIAEEIGLIEALSRDLLRKAASAAALWPDDVSLSFNLSAEQLSKPDAGDEIVAALDELGFPASRFEIEVTETAIMKNIEAARATIDTLRAAGVRVALDDFGAGYSSLSQVRDLTLDKIKIDRSFVDRVCQDAKIASLTRAIVDLCRRLDLPCVAEGIESPDQLAELTLGGCAGGQGWLFARAMPEGMVASFLRARGSTTA
jgi:diguanylate cyclase (GGDEF)-like protein